ncbi:MAG: hypothetical protein GC181_00820 [Bacteroidetes bacterium]|nr:hypothetical protein [Bacteroidota bacterium]
MILFLCFVIFTKHCDAQSDTSDTCLSYNEISTLASGRRLSSYIKDVKDSADEVVQLSFSFYKDLYQQRTAPYRQTTGGKKPKTTLRLPQATGLELLSVYDSVQDANTKTINYAKEVEEFSNRRFEENRKVALSKISTETNQFYCNQVLVSVPENVNLISIDISVELDQLLQEWLNSNLRSN